MIAGEKTNRSSFFSFGADNTHKKKTIFQVTDKSDTDSKNNERQTKGLGMHKLHSRTVFIGLSFWKQTYTQSYGRSAFWQNPKQPENMIILIKHKKQYFFSQKCINYLQSTWQKAHKQFHSVLSNNIEI